MHHVSVFILPVDSWFDFWVCERILGLCLVMMSFIVKYFRISNHRMTKPFQCMVMLHIHSMPVVRFAVWLPAVWNSRTTPKVVISFIDLFQKITMQNHQQPTDFCYFTIIFPMSQIESILHPRSRKLGALVSLWLEFYLDIKHTPEKSAMIN